MKKYTIRPEFLSLWGSETTEETVIDAAEVERLAAEWETPVEELLEQLKEIEMEDNTMTITVNSIETTMEAAAALMDDEIREAVHAEGITDPQEFVGRYCELHHEKYGNEFTV